jgi:glycosyltransferase involved in cell wall biosynthesis
VETHVRQLAQGCARAGDSVTVLTHEVAGRPAREWLAGVEVLRFPLALRSHAYPFSLRLHRYLRRHAADFDLVHAHNYHNLVAQAAAGAGLPFVFTPHYHGTGHSWLARAGHRLYRGPGGRLFTAANAVICVSQPELDLVRGHFPAAAGKAVVIPNGSDPGRPGLAGTSSRAGPPMVLTVGRLERYKNVDLIIEAVRALPAPAELVIVGDGPDRPRLQRCASAAGPDCRVQFTGRVPDARLGQLLTQAVVISSASDHEAFGLTLAEGLAAGARVVASAIPAHAAFARLAGPDAPVTLADPRDTSRFAAVLASALAAGRLAPASLSLPSWADVVEQTRELYSRLEPALAESA